MKNSKPYHSNIPERHAPNFKIGPGITLREHFAGQAMQAVYFSSPEADPEIIARIAVEQADALLAELEK